MLASTTQLNTPGIALGAMPDVHALTDVTGFGLLGHLMEICRGSALGATIDFDRLPLHPGVLQFARDGIVTGASGRNWAGVGDDVDLAPAHRRGGTRAADGSADLRRTARRLRAGSVAEILALFHADGFAHAAVIGAVGRRAAHRGPVTLKRRRGIALALRRGGSLSIVMMCPALHRRAAPQPANAGGAFGLYPAPSFRLATGECRDCAAIRQALWYFRDETIAVPLAGHPVSGFATGVHADDDVRAWAAARAARNADRLSAAGVGGRTRHRARRAAFRRCVAADHPRRRAAVPPDREDSAQSLLLRRVVGCVLPAARDHRARHAGPRRLRRAHAVAGRFSRRRRRAACARNAGRTAAGRSVAQPDARGTARRRAKPLCRVDAVAEDRHARRLGGPSRAGIHGQRRAGRRRRGARRALRARHRPRAGRRADRRLAGQQFLFAGCRERKGHPRRAGSARQLPGRPQFRPGLVPAVVHGRRAC